MLHRGISLNSQIVVAFAFLFSITVYGDLLKRLLAPFWALGALYALACCWLLMVFFIFVRRRVFRTNVYVMIPFASIITLYFIQIFVHPQFFSLDALVFFLYFLVPVTSLILWNSFSEEIDTRRIVFIFGIFMLPHHIVAIIQMFFEQGFGVSTAYSEHGGVILRSFIAPTVEEHTTVYARLPGLFVSADRYAGMSALQVALSAYLVSLDRKNTSIDLSKFIFLLTLGILGLFISGVRSRTGIGISSILAATMACYLYWYLSERVALSKVFRHLVGFLLGAIPIIGVFWVMNFDSLIMLKQTLMSDDIFIRFGQMFAMSLPPADVTMVGQGIGSLGARPAEFGIWAMWRESGLLFSSFLLLSYFTVIVVCMIAIIGGIRANNVGDTSVIFCFLGFLMFGMLAGFSTNFEYSLGLALFTLTGMALRRSAPKWLVQSSLFGRSKASSFGGISK
ncbi:MULTISPECIES: hypothetical protein [unclassified Roseobacter]|uniref:hypothetical protein n=1 Tax=unclassified Roseobacter TaxID=196798 RepID=UPI0030EF826D